MEKDFHSQKISLLNEKAKEQDPSPLEFRYNLVGIEVQWWVHGPSKVEIVDFFKSYFHYFPSLNLKPKVTIHFYSSPKDKGGPGDPTHEMWNEVSEAFVFHIEGNERFVKQRDFVAMQNITTKVIRATGPVLDLICCDCTDNLVQFALTTSLLESDVLPLHSATVVVDGKAYIFYGESGAGKSTLAKQSYELDRYKVLGGDQILLKEDRGVLMAYSNSTTVSDFEREHPGWARGGYPVRALIHLKRVPREYSFRRFPFQDAISLILRECSLQGDLIDPKTLLDLVFRVGDDSKISFGELSYKKDESFWKRFLGELNATG